MLILEIAAKLLVLFAVWLLLSSPFLYIALRSLRALSRRGHHSAKVACAFGCVVSVIVAPIPTPIITFFLPHSFALIDPTYYEQIFGKDAMFQGLLPWVYTSISVTAVIAAVIAILYFRAAAKR